MTRAAPLLVAALLLVVLPVTGRALAQQVPLVFGVLNQQSVVLTAERWNPILQYVSSVSRVPLRLKLGRTVQETDEMMGRGEFDFIYTNHNFQTEYDALGYRVIGRWGGEPIRCVIAVSPDSLVIDEDGGTPRGVSDARRVVHERTGLRPTPLGADERHAVLSREVDNPDQPHDTSVEDGWRGV